MGEGEGSFLVAREIPRSRGSRLKKCVSSIHASKRLPERSSIPEGLFTLSLDRFHSFAAGSFRRESGQVPQSDVDGNGARGDLSAVSSNLVRG